MTKSVLDFLSEWAEEQGNWAKLLISFIINKESVTDQEREEIYRQFLMQIGATPALNIKEVITSTFKKDFANSTILLDSLAEVKGVNKLALNQELKFASNLTVVYGNNGSGKTGYSRIMKSLGFSYDQYTQILSNVFDVQQTENVALIKYNIDNVPKEFRWNDKLSSDDLSCIGVFNTECVKLSLDGKRNFIATPRGFHLFNLVSNELEKLHSILSEDAISKRKQPRFIEELTQDAEVFKYINSINHATKKEEVDSVFSFSDEDELQLQNLKTEKEQLNKLLIAHEIDNYQKKINELSTLVTRLETTSRVVNVTFWEAHFSNLDMLNALEEKQQIGIEAIVKDKGVAFYQSEKFSDFIIAAEKYIKIIDNPIYPSEADNCIYCLQPLEVNSRILLESYRTLLNDTTKADIEILKSYISKDIQSITNIKTELVLNHDPFDLNDDNTPIIPIGISSLFIELEEYKIALISSMKIKSGFKLNYESAIEIINSRIEGLSAYLKSKQDLLSVIEHKETEIINLINGLKDSEKVSTNKPIIFDYIDSLKYAYLIDSNKQKFNTRGLSTKSTSARRELIEQRFEEIFTEELRKLKCPLSISLNFGTQRSIPKLEQNINNQFSLHDVFSEGEQKSVALANFITELKISGTIGPVIFDDPVNSLDHERISIVAKRLIHLSLERQTIIFTHNVLLFYAIEQIIKESKMSIDYIYYTVEKDLNFTGYLYENVPPHKETYRTYESKINSILNSSKDERTQRESKLAQEGYNHLRSAIELLVEDEIFKQVVKRYKRNITFGQFEKINGTTFDTIKEELTEVFHQSCCYIEAHSNPVELAELPTLEQLKQDFERIKEIRKLFQ
jgi:hypothetical protein